MNHPLPVARYVVHIYRNESRKPIERFVADFSKAVEANGFLVHNEDKMAMAKTFGAHGAGVAEDFDLHMIQICKPQKAAKSLSKNPERAVLMPKFIMAFSQNGKTQVRFMHYYPETVAQLVGDAEFPTSLQESFAQIIGVIKETV